MKRLVAILLALMFVFTLGCGNKEAEAPAKDTETQTEEMETMSAADLATVREEATYLKAGLLEAQDNPEAFLAEGEKINFSEPDILKAAVERGVYPNEAQAQAAYDYIKDGKSAVYPRTDEEVAEFIASDDAAAIEDYRWHRAIINLMTSNIYNYDLVQAGLPMAMLPEDIAALTPGLENAAYDADLFAKSREGKLDAKDSAAIDEIDKNWRELQGVEAK